MLQILFVSKIPDLKNKKIIPLQNEQKSHHPIDNSNLNRLDYPGDISIIVTETVESTLLIKPSIVNLSFAV